MTLQAIKAQLAQQTRRSYFRPKQKVKEAIDPLLGQKVIYYSPTGYSDCFKKGMPCMVFHEEQEETNKWRQKFEEDARKLATKAEKRALVRAFWPNGDGDSRD